MAGSTSDVGDLVRRGYRFALSLTHDTNRAEDLVQDAWFSVLRAQGPWSRAYLFRAVRSRFIDECRRNGRVSMEPLSGHEEHECDSESEDWSNDRQVFIANGEFKRLLGELRAEERAVLYLSAIENYTAQQISDLLDWPRGTVLSLLHRTRGKLRERLKPES